MKEYIKPEDYCAALHGRFKQCLEAYSKTVLEGENSNPRGEEYIKICEALNAVALDIIDFNGEEKKRKRTSELMQKEALRQGH